MKIRISMDMMMPFVSLMVLSGLLGCAQERKAEEIRPVRTVVAAPQMRGESSDLVGRIEAHTYVNASFRLSGRVAERLVSVGDTVKAGQVLARLDASLESDALKNARAELARAKAVHDHTVLMERRYGALVRTQAVSQSEYDEAVQQLKSSVAAVQSAEAAMHVAEEQKGFTILKAETSGIVTEQYVEAGEVVSAGQPIVRIAENKSIDAVFDMPEEFVLQGVTSGRKIAVRLSGNEHIRAEATVYQVSPQADAVTRTYLVKAVIADAPPQMLLGATVIGVFATPRSASMQVPASALTTDNDRNAVWVVDPASLTVHATPVDIARHDSDTVVLAGGLKADDIVVIAGVQSLHQGQKVRLLGD